MRQYKKVQNRRSWHILGGKLRRSLQRTLQVRFRSAARFSSQTAHSYVGSVAHVIILGLLVVLSTGGSAAAVQSSSAHYGVDETFFGSGGELNACSTNYCSKQTAGETAVGNSSSASYQVQAGNNTDRDNSLEMIVPVANINVGQLTTTSTKVATATFSVKSYLASGYVVQTSSPGPQNGSHTLQLLGSPTGSSTSSEQFGINLAANGCPANTTPTGFDNHGGCSGTFGAAPVAVPDSSFSFGHAESGYSTADSYQYHDGGVIARSGQSSGETDYTISYLFNVSAVTPGGTYTMRQSLVATSTF